MKAFIKLGLGLLMAAFTIALNHSYASEDADAGKAVFEEHCALCHALPNPADLTVEWWREKVGQMAPLAQLNDDDRVSVEAYVTAHAGNINEILASERAVFVEGCGGCHTPDSLPASDRDLNSLRSFLIDHMIEQTDEEPEDEMLHEASEYLLHRQLAPVATAP